MAIPKLNNENEKPTTPTICTAPAESSASAIIKPANPPTLSVTSILEFSKPASSSVVASPQPAPAAVATLWQRPAPGTLLVEKPPANRPFNPHPRTPSPPTATPAAWSRHLNYATMGRPTKPFYEPHLDREKLEKEREDEGEEKSETCGPPSVVCEQMLGMLDKKLKEKEDELEKLRLEGFSSEKGEDEGEDGEWDEEEKREKDLKDDKWLRNERLALRMEEWLQGIEDAAEKAANQALGINYQEDESLSSGNPYEDTPLFAIAEELPGETDE